MFGRILAVMIVFLWPITLSAQLEIKRVFENLPAFSAPILLTHAGDASNRLFVVEQRGVIHAFENRADVGSRTTFLDLRGNLNSQYAEAGLLGLAFHPAYASSGKLYVYYTAGSGLPDFSSRVSEFSVSSDGKTANPASERVLMTVAQPAGNHNAGHMAFGPDGMLYIAFGDGGGANDQYRNGQNRSSLLGSIVRIDVDSTTGTMAYAIPADNPFVGNNNGWREEVWAWGLRNPWRFSFDRATGELWAADVGQNDWEEIDIIEKGQNYGWNVMEGFHCFRSTNCDMTGLVLPVFEYDHSQGRSVTGGYVYRGSKAPQLTGLYIYGDYVSRRVWALQYQNGQVNSNTQIGASPGFLSSFGEDEAGELYLVTHDTGRIYRFEDPSTTGIEGEESVLAPAAFALHPAFPNPFNPETAIRFDLAQSAFVDITVFDALGKRIKTLLSAQKNKGAHRVLWDARDATGQAVSAGVYFVKFYAAGFRQTQKIVLLK